MKKKLVVALAVGAAAGLASYFWIQHELGKPFYVPGSIRAGINLHGPLVPPDQVETDDATWRVEDDITLHHFSQGEGEPVLVVHGGPGYPFRAPIAALDGLADRFQFHYYDQRGSGRSSRPIESFESSSNAYGNMKKLEQTLGFGTQVADIERIRCLLGVERLTLLGHSFGGFIATMYAAEFPERVERLILVAPADMLVLPQPEGNIFELIAQRLNTDDATKFETFLGDYMDFSGMFGRTTKQMQELNAWFGAYYFAAASGTRVTQPTNQFIAFAPGWMTHAIYLSMGRRHDYTAALASVTAPTLVLHGATDMVPPDSSHRYAATLPNARVIVIPNAGHSPFEDQPEAFAAPVEQFLFAESVNP